jgi:DNA-binding XRE family transcriptional regulator
MKDWMQKDIKDFREEMGLTQTAFGQLIGVSRNFVYYLERGERKASKTLKLLLDCIYEKEKRKGGKKNAKGSL